MWFEQLFGFTEQSPAQVKKNLSLEGTKLTSLVNKQTYECGTLEVPELGELRSDAAVNAQQTAGRTTFRQVVGDVQDLHTAPESQKAMFQVASQFNLLEMATPNAIPEDGVGIYEYDHTQGPACAIAAGAGTVFRNYFVPLNDQTGQSKHDQIDCLSDIAKTLRNESKQLWHMKNGYAFASASGLRIIADHLATLEKESLDLLRAKLHVGIMWNTEVTIGQPEDMTVASSGKAPCLPTHVSQIYCSAVPVSYSSEPASAWEPFARLILEATYEASLNAAVINQARNGSNLLFLTMIGGGAFGNPTEWIVDAMRRALRIHKNSGLDVRLVSHRSPNPHLNSLVSEFQA